MSGQLMQVKENVGNGMPTNSKGKPMNTSGDNMQFFLDQAEAQEGLVQSKLLKFKKDALDKFQEQGVPTSAVEAWKYTNISKLLPNDLKSPSKASGSVEAHAISSAEINLVFINGEFVENLSSADLGKFVSLYDLNEELPAEFFRERKSKELPQNQPFYALNSSLFKKLVYINMPAKSTQKVEVTYISCPTMKSELTNPRVFIKLNENAVLDLVENFVSYEDKGSITNHVVEAFCEKGSKLNHFKIQNVALSDTHISSIYFEVEEESVAKTSSLNFGSALTRNEVYPTIRGERSEAWLLGANIITDRQQVDNFTVIEHVAPNCESHELYKGLYGGHSKGIFTGTIIVREEAQKTNAYQSNATLLCSDDAESISRPQLKIWADDVKCSHGATVGQLDDDALFYLRARGISEVDARAILTKAYVSDVLNHIEDTKLHASVTEILANKLEQVL